MKLFLVFFLIFFSFSSSENDLNKIAWSETEKLSWSDFRGKPVSGADFVASTSSGISFSYSFRTVGDEIDYNYSVESYFYPEESWYNPKYASDYILRHEQAHFDISEIFARILRKEIAETKFSMDLKNEIEGIYQNSERKRREMQDRFDLETEHSKNSQKEYQWEVFIANKLKEYEQWK